MDLTLLSGELWSWLPIAVLLTAAYFIYRALYRPINLRSVETYSNQSRNFKALRSKSFPPPYPNGWYRICNSVDIDGGRVKSVAALGTHFVAFRNSKREAGGPFIVGCGGFRPALHRFKAVFCCKPSGHGIPRSLREFVGENEN